MKKNKVFPLFYILVLIIFIAFGTALVIRLAELHRGDEFYKQIGEKEEPMSVASVNSTLPAATAAGFAVSKEQKGGYVSPKINELSLQLSQFAGEYPDTVFWLQLPGTLLDYPVMLGKDNQFYLNHLPDGSKNALGSLFLDCRTREDSAHLIVYGHNGTGGKMFGLLKRYESQDYFLEHKTLIVAASDSIYICPIFSVRWVEADSDAYRLEFKDGSSLTNYINQAAEESLYQIDVDSRDAAKVLTLSTCGRWKGNRRFIVQALLLPVQ